MKSSTSGNLVEDSLRMNIGALDRHRREGHPRI